MYNNNLTEDIIESINDIETVTMESELSVLTSLMKCYDKQCMIMEYCNDITVFQETSLFMEAGEDGTKKKENILKKILLFIPRIIMSTVKYIRNFLKRNKEIPSGKKVKIIVTNAKDAKDAKDVKDVKYEIEKILNTQLTITKNPIIKIDQKMYIEKYTKCLLDNCTLLTCLNDEIEDILNSAAVILNDIRSLFEQMSEYSFPEKINERLRRIVEKYEKSKIKAFKDGGIREENLRTVSIDEFRQFSAVFGNCLRTVAETSNRVFRDVNSISGFDKVLSELDEQLTYKLVEITKEISSIINNLTKINSEESFAIVNICNALSTNN